MPALDSEAFLKRLRATFRVEAAEHLQAMSALVQELEQPVSAERVPVIVETLFREAHSLKGAARAVNLFDIEALCAEMENMLAPLKREGGAPDEPLVASLLQDVDELRHLLEELAIEAQQKAIRTASGDSREEAGARTPAAALPESGAAAPVRAPAAPERGVEAGEMIRVPASRLATLLVQAEELHAFKSGGARLAHELDDIRIELEAWKKAWGKTAAEARAWRREQNGRDSATDASGRSRQRAPLDKLLDAVERDEVFVKALADRMVRLQQLAQQEQRTLGSIADTLQEDLKQVLMQPFSALFEILPLLVRDLARDQGKQIELRLEGESIEMDRRILEQMKDPLIHLVRNAVDHGIEVPEARRQKGKSEKGRIEVVAAPKEGNQVELLIADDGAGIDVDRVVASALKLGVVSQADIEGKSRKELLGLVYASGLSTSPILTDISGRGLGLAIVQERVEKLGGSIAIDVPEGGGTRFRALLPTALANFHGLCVGVGDRQFVLPARNVRRVTRIAPSAIRTVEGREAIEVDSRAVSLVWLADLLGLPPKQGQPQEGAFLCVVVLATAGAEIAFVVDAVRGEQAVLVKGLGPQLKRVRHIAGATVLGAGELVPVLSVPDLMKSAMRAPLQRSARTSPPASPVPQRQRQSILVAEDSITSRTLLKNILESAGYEVTTAVDGIDALTALRTGQFDLVVSDVEMPRMDGFDLASRIRRDAKLSHLPVVLVTALASREHKERGIEAGADAYIVKSSFDQSNLLEVIGRLI